MYLDYIMLRERIKKLLEENGNVNVQYENGNTLLHTCSKNSYYDLIELLLDKNANPNIENILGETPLTLVTLNAYSYYVEHMKIVEALISHGAHINHQNKSGRTPLMNSALLENEEIVKYLLQKGADPFLKTIDLNTVYGLLLAKFGNKESNVGALIEEKMLKIIDEKGMPIIFGYTRPFIKDISLYSISESEYLYLMGRHYTRSLKNDKK